MRNTMVVVITRLVKEVDLRRVHAYRERYSKKLQMGQAVMLVNWACDKIRLIDSAGGVHNYYAPSGEVFDVDLIQKHVAALRLSLAIPAQGRAYLNWSEVA